MSLQDVLTDHIRQSNTLELTYKGRTFILEPYAIWQTENKQLMLHGYKISGEYEKKPPPHWSNIYLSGITRIVKVDIFIVPHKGYNPKKFSNVAAEWLKLQQ